MSDKMRWKYGDPNPVMAAVNSATVVEIGDLVWHDTDDAKPASDAAYTGTLGEAQTALSTYFLGVAMQRSLAGETAPIRVATEGVFEFDCASSTHELGEKVGPDDNTGGTALENQKVIAVTDPARAIGRVAKRVSVAATTVLVEINSTIMRGSLQGVSASGS